MSRAAFVAAVDKAMTEHSGDALAMSLAVLAAHDAEVEKLREALEWALKFVQEPPGLDCGCLDCTNRNFRSDELWKARHAAARAVLAGGE